MRELNMLPVILSVLLALSAGATPHAVIARTGQSTRARESRVLTSALVGAPVAAGDYVFWKDRRSGHVAIYGYDLAARAEFVIADQVDPATALASDGATFAWVARDQAAGRAHIQGYDLRARATSTIITLAATSLPAEIALDRGVLYYSDSATNHRGLFARDLASGREQRVSPRGARPVAADGALLWSEQQSFGPGHPALWSLHLRTLDGRHSDTVLASGAVGYSGFEGYDVAGDRVVWAFAASSGDPRAHLYTISTAASAPISPGAAGNPLILGATAVWTVGPSGAPGQANRWSVQSVDLAAGRISTVVEESAAEVVAWAIAEGGALVLSVARDPDQGARELIVSGLGERGLRFGGAPTTAEAQIGSCDPAAPISCGQVRSGDDARFADDGGRWAIQGVQFMLPQFGINGKTFWDGNFAAASADGSAAFWLDRAQSYLRANTLRIFVDMPYKLSSGTIITPTSYSTLYAFATEANARGMRLGISLHNSADWAMTPERATWIAGLIDFFVAQQSLPAIAYLNADNEINNHCVNAQQDCFDSQATYDAQPYIDGAVGWVAQFRALVKSHAPQLLVTVGISTEMIDADTMRAGFDFFRPDSQGRTLASLADFLAPHNYRGGAAGVIDDLRVTEVYSGAIVLEEYGYPTDPWPRDLTWTEGEPRCWLDPLQAGCGPTAPFFVETNLRALRAKGYAGGVAWMLADMREKDTASSCTDSKNPFDLWTGLFAIGGVYCEGGTATRGLGQPKATALRVCATYAGAVSSCTAGTPFSFKAYLPRAER
jgi:hypothetical protein